MSSKEFKKLLKTCNPFIFYSEQLGLKYDNPTHEFQNVPLGFKISEALPTDFTLESFVSQATDKIIEIYKKITDNFPELFKVIFVDAPLDLIDMVLDFLHKVRTSTYDFMQAADATLQQVVEAMKSFIFRLTEKSNKVLETIFESISGPYTLVNRMFAALNGYIKYIAKNVHDNFVQGLKGMYTFFFALFLPWKTSKSSVLIAILSKATETFKLIAGGQHSALYNAIPTQDKTLYALGIPVGEYNSPMMLALGKFAHQFCALSDMHNLYGQMNDYVEKTNVSLTTAFVRLFIKMLEDNKKVFKMCGSILSVVSEIPYHFIEKFALLTNQKVVMTKRDRYHAFGKIPEVLIAMFKNALSNHQMLECQTLIGALFLQWAGVMSSITQTISCYLSRNTDLKTTIEFNILEYNLHAINFSQAKTNVGDSIGVFKQLSKDVKPDDADMIYIFDEASEKIRQVLTALDSMEYLKFLDTSSHPSIGYLVLEEGECSLNMFKSAKSLGELNAIWRNEFLFLRDKITMRKLASILRNPKLENAMENLRMSFMIPNYYDVLALNRTGLNFLEMVASKIEAQRRVEEGGDSSIGANIYNYTTSTALIAETAKFSDLLTLILDPKKLQYDLTTFPEWNNFDIQKAEFQKTELKSTLLETIEIPSEADIPLKTLETGLFQKQHDIFYESKAIQPREKFEGIEIDRIFENTYDIRVMFKNVLNSNLTTGYDVTLDTSEFAHSTNLAERIISTFGVLIRQILNPQFNLLNRVLGQSQWKQYIDHYFERIKIEKFDEEEEAFLKVFQQTLIKPLYLCIREIAIVINDFSLTERNEAKIFEATVELEELKQYAKLIDSPFSDVFSTLFTIENSADDINSLKAQIDQTQYNFEIEEITKGEVKVQLIKKVDDIKKFLKNNAYFEIAVRDKMLDVLTRMCTELEIALGLYTISSSESTLDYFADVQTVSDKGAFIDKDLYKYTCRLVFIAKKKVFTLFRRFFVNDRLTTSNLIDAWKSTFVALLNKHRTKVYLTKEREKAKWVILATAAAGLTGMGVVGWYGLLPMFESIPWWLLGLQIVGEGVNTFRSGTRGENQPSNETDAPVGSRVWEIGQATIESVRKGLNKYISFHLIKGENSITIVNNKQQDFFTAINFTNIDENDIKRIETTFLKAEGSTTTQPFKFSELLTPNTILQDSKGRFIKPKVLENGKTPFYKLVVNPGLPQSPMSIMSSSGHPYATEEQFKGIFNFFNVFEYEDITPRVTISEDTISIVPTDSDIEPPMSPIEEPRSVTLSEFLEIPKSSLMEDEKTTSYLYNKYNIKTLGKLYGDTDSTIQARGIPEVPNFGVSSVVAKLSDVKMTVDLKYAEMLKKNVSPDTVANWLVFENFDLTTRVMPWTELKRITGIDPSQVVDNEQFKVLLVNMEKNKVIFIPPSLDPIFWTEVQKKYQEKMEDVIKLYNITADENNLGFPNNSTVIKIRDDIETYVPPDTTPTTGYFSSMCNAVLQTISSLDVFGFIESYPAASLIMIPFATAFFGGLVAASLVTAFFALKKFYIARKRRKQNLKFASEDEDMEAIIREFKNYIDPSAKKNQLQNSEGIALQGNITKIETELKKVREIGTYTLFKNFKLASSVSGLFLIVGVLFAFSIQFLSLGTAIAIKIVKFIANFIIRWWQRSSEILENPGKWVFTNIARTTINSVVSGTISTFVAANFGSLFGESAPSITTIVSNLFTSDNKISYIDGLVDLPKFLGTGFLSGAATNFVLNFINQQIDKTVINFALNPGEYIQKGAMVLRKAEQLNDKYKLLSSAWGVIESVKTAISAILGPVVDFWMSNELRYVKDIGKILQQTFLEITEKIRLFVAKKDDVGILDTLKTGEVASVLKTEHVYYQIGGILSRFEGVETFVDFRNREKSQDLYTTKGEIQNTLKELTPPTEIERDDFYRIDLLSGLN
jgi:hypothetical protein